MHFFTDQAQFLKLVSQNKILPCLKTFSDSILFYYLGHLSLNTNSEGQISEIGVGGSTYPLLELAEKHNKTFYVIDNNSKRLDQFTDSIYWPKANVEKIAVNSNKLREKNFNTGFLYCHVDGDKDYNLTINDIKFYLDNLSPNGLICQDDYGNHKWPTVTDAVKELEYRQDIKIILVGDSSVWFTKPQYYDYWLNILEHDYEYSLLKAVCNIASSLELGKTPEYHFMQNAFNCYHPMEYTETELRYFQNLNHYYVSSLGYLKMPYAPQSQFSRFLTEPNPSEYLITRIYNTIKSEDWPPAPVSKKEIEHLPDWIKDELVNLHKIDLYKRIPI